MIVGRTGNVIKIKTDGTTRAVNCACCGPKCYPVPFDPTGWVIIPTATGNNIFNATHLNAQIDWAGSTSGGSSPIFAATGYIIGDDCRFWSGNIEVGTYPNIEYWYFDALCYKVSGIFYFSYSGSAFLAGYEPIIANKLPSFVPNNAISTSATLLGYAITSEGGNTILGATPLDYVGITITL